MTDSEIHLLVDGVANIKKLIIYLAVYKAHTFVSDFVMNNIRDSFFNMNEKLSHANLNEFFTEKKYVHLELEAITDKIVVKIRHIVFCILE